MMSIRLVEATDPHSIEEVRRLFRSYASEFAGSIAESLCLQGFESELEALPGRYAPPAGCLLLALVEDRSAGCVALRDLGGGTCEMKRLYVASAHRGRGLGEQLIEGIVGWAERAGYRRMVLDTLPEMTAASALYRRHGFVETDRYWDNPIGQAIYMERRLGGAGTAAGESLAEVVQADMAAYFEHLGARVVRLVESLTHEQIWAQPFGFGNSVGRIVVHLNGSLNHYIGAVVAGTGYVRNRPDEFNNPSRPSTEELLGAFQRTIEMVVRTLRAQGEAGLTTPVRDCDEPVRDRFGLFLVCAAHVNNHVGQMVYLVQAHGHRLDERSW